MSKQTELTQGEQFNNWTVLSSAGTDERNNKVYNCQCVCGTIRKVRKSNLGKVTGCGCVRQAYAPRTPSKKTVRAMQQQIDQHSNPEKMVVQQRNTITCTIRSNAVNPPTNIMIDRKREQLQLQKELANEYSLDSYL